MARQYKNFLRILEKWPIDASKGDRDLGLLVRHRIKFGFPNGETTLVNQEECESIHGILKRLVENHHLNLHERNLKSSATGLSAEECKALISTEFLKEVEKEERSVLSRLFGTKRS